MKDPKLAYQNVAHGNAVPVGSVNVYSNDDDHDILLHSVKASGSAKLHWSIPGERYAVSVGINCVVVSLKHAYAMDHSECAPVMDWSEEVTRLAAASSVCEYTAQSPRVPKASRVGATRRYRNRA